MTDALMLAAENTTIHIIPGYGEAAAGRKMGARWVELLSPAAEPEPDTRTTRAIVDDIWARGLKRGE